MRELNNLTKGTEGISEMERITDLGVKIKDLEEQNSELIIEIRSLKKL